MNLLLVLPIIVPMSTAALSLLLWRWRRWQSALVIAGMIVLALSAISLLVVVWRDGIQSTQMGNWPAPFGITLVADTLSAIMLVVAACLGVAVAIYSLYIVDEGRKALGYYPILNILLMGVCGSFLTGDLFNLYVWFEVMLIASFVLLALGGERTQVEAALKYFALNLFSSTLFLIAVGVLYATTGSLNMADLAVALRSGELNAGLITTVAALFLVAFGIKSAVFPLYFWLPASYHTPPAAVSAIFAGLLTKVGVYALLRVFTLLFVGDVGYTHEIIIVVAGLTMVSGVLGALAQVEFRRVLSFQVISTIGYMLMGLGLFTPLALAGSVFYMLQDMIVKTNLFLISGVTLRITGSDGLPALGGLYRRSALVALLFFVSAMALAGIPPLPAFFAKLALLQAAMGAREYAIAGTALAVSLLTLLSMSQLWSAWWRPAPTAAPLPGTGASLPPEIQPGDLRLSDRGTWGMLGPVMALTAVLVCLGLAAGPVFALSERAAEQLFDPTAYIEAVLGDSG